MQAAQERLLDLSLALLGSRWPWPVRYGIAVIVTLGVAVLKLAVPPFGAQGPDLFLAVPVAASAVLAGFGPALLATAGTTAIAAYFTPPTGLAIALNANALDVVGFFVEGFIVAALGAALRGAFGRTLESLKRREELERERSALIATVNHELRNPLSALSGYLELASRYAARDDLRGRLPATLQEARLQITRLIRLADDLTLIARSATAESFHVEPRTLDLGTAVEAAARRAERFDPTRTVTASAGSAPIQVNADPTRLDQILDNLLKNAVSYSPRGTPVEIAATAEPALGRAMVRVRDRGAGVGSSDRERIFERLVRGSAADTVPGMGLGLYVSRELATRMGGDLSLEESSAAGSVFALSLTLVESAGEIEQAETAAAAS